MKKVIYSSIVFLLAFIVITACVHGNTAPAKPSDTVKAKQTQRSHFSASQQNSSSSSQTSSSQTSTAGENNSSATNKTVPSESIDSTDPKSHVGGEKVQLNISTIVQRRWNYCAPATVSMILASQGLQVDQAQLANAIGKDETFGTHNSNAIKVLNRHLFGYDVPSGNQAGYRLATVTNPNSDSEDMRLFKKRLIQNINGGYPMYYTFNNSKIYPGKSGEHNVIGVGYVLTEDGSDVAYVYYLDPSYLVQDSVYGGLKIVSPEELLNAMVSCTEPNYAW